MAATGEAEHLNKLRRETRRRSGHGLLTDIASGRPFNINRGD